MECEKNNLQFEKKNRNPSVILYKFYYISGLFRSNTLSTNKMNGRITTESHFNQNHLQLIEYDIETESVVLFGSIYQLVLCIRLSTKVACVFEGMHIKTTRAYFLLFRLIYLWWLSTAINAIVLVIFQSHFMVLFLISLLLIPPLFSGHNTHLIPSLFGGCSWTYNDEIKKLLRDFDSMCSILNCCYLQLHSKIIVFI